jgi:pimeloyl-ACP methyl ester carboxylesterase
MTTFTLHGSPVTESRPAALTRRTAPEHASRSLCIVGEALAGLDWLALRLSPAYAGTGIPRGDGSAVVLVPGMLASNASLLELRGWLRRVGYRPYFTEIGRNDGCPERTLECVVAAVDRAYESSGARVHIVGHSLGGLLARGAAMARPGRVASVVTLGSPVNGVRIHPFVAMLGATLMRGDCDGTCVETLQRPLPPHVRETSIYSKSDGIVEWQTCRGASCRAVEVRGSHIGLIANADAYRAIAETLAQPVPAFGLPPRTGVVHQTMPMWLRRAA